MRAGGNMLTKKVIVQNEHGLHARVAMHVAETSKCAQATVTVCRGCKCADGCSVLQLLMLEAEQGAEIELLISGGNEEQCLRNIAAIFNNGSGI
jgi:phosphotransferase system HPr (HPr) family protein